VSRVDGRYECHASLGHGGRDKECDGSDTVPVGRHFRHGHGQKEEVDDAMLDFGFVSG